MKPQHKNQLHLPPMPVERVDIHGDDQAKADVNEVDMPLDQAQAAIGRAVTKTIHRSESALKDFGDKAQTHRWCHGENPNLARLWQRPDVRRELVQALAEESGFADVNTHIIIRRRA